MFLSPFRRALAALSLIPASFAVFGWLATLLTGGGAVASSDMSWLGGHGILLNIGALIASVLTLAFLIVLVRNPAALRWWFGWVLFVAMVVPLTFAWALLPSDLSSISASFSATALTLVILVVTPVNPPQVPLGPPAPANGKRRTDWRRVESIWARTATLPAMVAVGFWGSVFVAEVTWPASHFPDPVALVIVGGVDALIFYLVEYWAKRPSSIPWWFGPIIFAALFYPAVIMPLITLLSAFTILVSTASAVCLVGFVLTVCRRKDGRSAPPTAHSE